MKNEKQQQAYNLYFQTSLSQAEIARIIDVDRRTIQNWMNDGNWRQLKKSAEHIPSRLVEQFYYMLANLNHDVLSRAHQPYPLTHEVEQMRKIAVCIRHVKNRQTINESIEAFTHFADKLMLADPDLAMRLRPHIQSHIKERADFRLADHIPGEYRIDPNIGEMFGYELRSADDDAAAPPAPPADPSGGVPAGPPEGSAPVLPDQKAGPGFVPVAA